MEPNAYFFYNTLTDRYGCLRSGETLDADGVPLGHMGFSKIKDLAESIKETEEVGSFPTPYNFVAGLPKNEDFRVDGGRKYFRPATEKELEELVETSGRKDFPENGVLLSYEKGQRRKEEYECIPDPIVDEIILGLAEGRYPPRLYGLPSYKKDDEKD